MTSDRALVRKLEIRSLRASQGRDGLQRACDTERHDTSPNHLGAILQSMRAALIRTHIELRVDAPIADAIDTLNLLVPKGEQEQNNPHKQRWVAARSRT